MRQELGGINFDHPLFLKGKQLKQLINFKSFGSECDGVAATRKACRDGRFMIYRRVNGDTA